MRKISFASLGQEMILGIDPGPETSGVVAWDGASVIAAIPEQPNAEVLEMARKLNVKFSLESIEAMYAHVGKETVRTIRFCGAIEEAVLSRGGTIRLMSPQAVKKVVCGTSSAKDPAVRQALIDRYGLPGTKRAPGALYGVTGHAWRALAVAVAMQIGLREAEG